MKTSFLIRRFVVAVVLLLGLSVSCVSAQTLNLHLQNSSTYADSDVWFTFSAKGAGGGTVAPAAAVTAYYGGGASVGSQVSMLWSNSYTYQPGGTGAVTYSTNDTWWSQSIRLSDLAVTSGTQFQGFQVAGASSARVYVSLGSALTVTAGGNLQDRALVTYGAPAISTTSSPNFNTRWDLFEMQVTPGFGDQGDVTAINSIGIPMSMQSYKSGTVVQATQNTGNWNTMAAALVNYVNSNTANNKYTPPGNLAAPVLYNGSGTTVDDIVRIAGVNNGVHAGFTPTPSGGGTIFTPAGGAGNIAAIGANATFQDYVNFVGTGTTVVGAGTSYVTPLEDRNILYYNGSQNAFYGFSGSTYAVDWTANKDQVISASWLSPVAGNTTVYNSGTITGDITGGSGKALVVEGYLITSTAAPEGMFNITATLGKYKITIPPDGGVGGSSFLLSSFLYASDASANYGGIFEYQAMSSTGAGGTLSPSSTYLYYNDFTTAITLSATSLVSMVANTNVGQTTMSQVIHDLAAGYNLGLVASNVIDPTTGQTFNDEGSYYWTNIWAKLATNPTFSWGGTTYYKGATFTWNGTSYVVGDIPLYQGLQSVDPYYNQWSALIYQSAPNSYGNPYSDYLQSVDVNLFTEPNTAAYNIDYVVVTILPEASTLSLLAVAGAVFAVMKSRRKAKRGCGEE